MALTLLEASKAMLSTEPLRASLIETFARETDLLRVLPFDDIPGNSHRFNQEGALPGIATRGVNEAYSESTGIINPQVESLAIIGGDLDVDRFLVRTGGPNVRENQEAMKLKALGHSFSHLCVKGDSTSAPKDFDGLQRRLTGTQLIAAGSTANGTPLSLAKLDETIERVPGATHLLMSRAMRRRLNTAARATGVSGTINYEKDEFGRMVMFYNDLPILIADGVRDVNASLAFNEAATSGTATGTSIYVLRIGEGAVQGIQNGAPMVDDLGHQDSKPVLRTRFEWYASLSIQDPYAAARLWSIADAAVTA